MLRHYDMSTLLEYAVDALPAERARRVADHLLSCSRCRADVELIRGTRSTLQDGPAGAMPDEAWDAIYRRRAGGERRILPADAPVARQRPRRRLLQQAAMLAAALIVGATALVLVRPAGAQWGELTLSPERPMPGDIVTVTYTASFGLGSHNELRLRGSLRAAGTQDRNLRPETLTALTRVGDGRYRGVVRFPESVVYATLAVEAPDASEVDDNGGRLWEMLAHAPDGTPLLAALAEKGQDLMGRNWEAAHATAQQAVALHPDSLAAWRMLLNFDRWLAGAESVDSVRAAHHQHFLRFQDQHAGDAPASMPSGELMWYARAVRDTAAVRYWRTHALEHQPLAPLTVQERVVEWVQSMRGEPRMLLDSVTAVWDAAGPVHDRLGQTGFSAALQLQDATAALLWADRYLMFWPDDRVWVARRLATLPTLQDEALRRLHGELTLLEELPDSLRGLDTTRDAARQSARPARATALTALATLLREGGQSDAARNILADALPDTWSPALHRQLLDLDLARGDTAAVAAVAARLLVDPAVEDSARERIGRTLPPLPAGVLDQARDDMGALALPAFQPRSLTRDVQLQDAAGGSVSVRSLTAEAPIVLVFWSRNCGAAIDRLQEFDGLWRELAPAGITVSLLVQERRSQEVLDFVAARGGKLPVLFDAAGGAETAFNNWGTPTYYVVRSNQIILKTFSRDDVVRVAALLGAAPIAAAGTSP
jgi:hypothetical protein